MAKFLLWCILFVLCWPVALLALGARAKTAKHGGKGRTLPLEELFSAPPRKVLGEGELIGEMAIFDREVRMATVRAFGKARVLTVDERNFLRRVHEDPSLAYRLVRTMSQRIRELTAEVARLQE